MVSNTRSPLAVTYSTLKALFLREALARLTGGRASLWIFLDPIFQMSILLFMFNVIRGRMVTGMDVNVWIMAGILTYTMFKAPMNQGMNAITANKALFTYRQVKPVDTIFARAFLEAFITLLITAILFSGAALFNLPIAPYAPANILIGVLPLWLMGLGAALSFSVLKLLVPEIGNVIGLLMQPLYITSGTIFPVSTLPLPYRDWLLFNPMLHGVELVRTGFSPFYHAINGIDIFYTYEVALVMLFLGLVLQRRFHDRLMTQ